MSQNEIHVGDIGTIFEATIYVEPKTVLDISAATTKTIMFQKPDGTVTTNTAGFLTDGSDGKVTYTIVTDDLDQIGDWGWQVRLIFPTGTWSANIKSFKVYANLDS